MEHCRLCLLISILFFSISPLTGQNDQLAGSSDHEFTAQEEQYIDSLSDKMGEFEIFKMTIESDDPRFKREFLELDLPSDMAAQWQINLYRDDLMAEQYVNRFQTENRIIQDNEIVPHVYRGLLNGRSEHRVGMTIYDDFLYGGVYDGEELYMIEPLRFFIDGAARDLFVLYASSTVLEKYEGKCGYEEYKDLLNKHSKREVRDTMSDRGNVVTCYELELAIASDFSMYTKYNNSQADVIAHNVGVINNVQTNYTGEFNDDIEFVIVEQFVSTCNTCDPWTSSTDAGVLLSDFRSWGNSGGFSAVFDLGELWTNRDFNGPTIGIAYLSSVCGFSKYHCLQDFTSNANLLRVLTAHEIGHNFSASHDPSGSNTIMAPTVNNTNQWSSQSVSEINNFIDIIEDDPNCLVQCNIPPPPTADFSGNPTTVCTGSAVDFTDESSGVVNSWDWTFNGGTPSTSTMENPTVTYNTAGTYDVSLEVSNSGGSDMTTKTGYITVVDPPVAGFTYTIFGQTVEFTNTSQNGDTYTWDFGDGNTSNDENPDHFYTDPGTYTVELTVENACSSDITTQTVEIIIAPEAAFSASPTDGCAELVVDFTDESENFPTQWTWSFEGGVPSSSAEQNPTVNYPEPGTYSVTLVVTNQEGSDQLVKTDFITVNGDPVANFNYSVDSLTVDFTNTSQDTDNYTWDFGDGNSSSEENPTHTYSSGGTYDVTLTVTNDCGTDDTVQSIDISTPPVADFAADTTEGCPALSVQFEDLSSNNTSNWNWSFPGGMPSSSTQQNPSVTYSSPGSYDVTLIAGNSDGNDTITREDFITVLNPSDASFSYTIDQYTVTFDNTSNNANTYEWHFGDGETSSEFEPVHTYDNDGSYDVMLIASGNCGPDTMVQTIGLFYPPEADFTADVTEGCEPLIVQYTSQASPNTDTWNWSFSGGNPSSSTEENPVVTYEEPGTYDVSLIVSNGQGSDQLLRQDYITVQPLPDADFTYVRDELFVEFTDQSSNADSWHWDFGDGTTSTQQNPDHTYSSHGTYDVVLIAENNCGPDTIEMELEVSSLPSANFTADVTEGCVPLTVTFSDQSSTNVNSWNWSFPGGDPETSSQENPEIVYNSPGTYDVSLIVSNNEGSDTMARQDFIEVLEEPTAEFMYTKNMDTVHFEDFSEDADAWMWDFGDGFTSVAQHPSHIYTEDGTYMVQLITTNQCGADTSTRTISVTTPPSAGFSALPRSGCIPQSIQFEDESGSNASDYLWTFEGGDPEISTEANPSVTYEEAGVFDVQLIVSNAVGSDTLLMEDYIEIGRPPLADFSFSADSLTVHFQDESIDADSLYWTFGDGTNGTGTTPVHEYTQEGLYTVNLIAVNECGTDTMTLEVGTSDYPQAVFDADKRAGCVPFDVQYTGTTENNVDSWKWTFEGGTPETSTEQNPVVTYEEAGEYDVKLTVSNAVGTHTLTKTNYVTALDVPEADFSVMLEQGKAIFVNVSDDADQYFWSFGDGHTDTTKNPIHEYLQSGEYTVQMIAENNCGKDTSVRKVQIDLSAVSDLTDASVQWNVFPNPTNGKLFIQCSSCTVQDLRWKVLTSNGREVKSGRWLDFGGPSERSSIDMQGHAPGMYFLELSDGKEHRYFRFIVQ